MSYNNQQSEFILEISYPFISKNSYDIVRDLINKSLEGLVDIYIKKINFIKYSQEEEDNYNDQDVSSL